MPCALASSSTQASCSPMVRLSAALLHLLCCSDWPDNCLAQ